MKGKILIITPNSLHNGPRLIREIDALKADFEIVAVGASPPHDSRVKFISFDHINYNIVDRIIRKLYRVCFRQPFPGLLPFKNRRLQTLIRTENPDYVIAHYPIELPYLISFPDRKFKIIYNAHEYHPLEFETNIEWLNNWGKLYTNIYRNCLNKVDLMINVCDSIAERCEVEFGKKSLVIPNAASYYPHIKPIENNEKDPVRIIHHGGANVEREIELMIDAMRELGDGYLMDLMLMPSDPAYLQRLKNHSSGIKGVRFIEPVNFDKIVETINEYDIGLFNLPPKNYNYAVALPNKLFEFIQARLCIVVSPSVEMKRIVEKYNLGKVSSDFTAKGVAEAIRTLSRDEINRYKQNADRVAKELSAERYQEQFLQEILKL